MGDAEITVLDKYELNNCNFCLAPKRNPHTLLFIFIVLNKQDLHVEFLNGINITDNELGKFLFSIDLIRNISL